jgi:lipopolysaccharide transport system ATP-binding protein
VSETVIRVEGLGKKYLLDHRRERPRYATLRDQLAGGVRALAGRLRHPLRPRQPGRTREEFWALREVCFEVRRGDVVGVVGRNGAGKSTLLKVLSRITEPTAGRVTLTGRVGSLLEVGTGFHPELTGRENVYLNGAILGMGRAEVRRKFDAIVAFAEVERFLDTPVKRYSSGMYVRLAFAVAAHLEPEILVVDEVLAVGDTAFQKKCLGKMGEVAREGRTVLFVSHNLAVVAGLCKRGLLLERGRLRADAPVGEVLALYGREAGSTLFEGHARADTPTVCRVELDPAALQAGALRLAVHFRSPFPFEPVVGVVVSTSQGAPVFGTNPVLHGVGYTPAVLAAGVAMVTVPALPLYSGTYRASVFLTDRHGTVYDVKTDALLFELVAPEALPQGLSTDVIGPLRTAASWSLEPEPAAGWPEPLGTARG